MTKVPAIVRTRSLRGGHYRAGLKHEAEPGDIPAGTITEEQLAQLRADPDLDVELIDPPQGPPKDPPPPPRKGKQAAPAAAEAGGAAEPGQDQPAEGGDAGDEDFGFDEAPAPEPAPEAKGK